MIADIDKKLDFRKKDRRKIEPRIYLPAVLIMLFIIIGFGVQKYIAYVAYHAAGAGEVTEIILTVFNQTIIWSGFYGIALREPAFNATVSETVDPGTITQKILLFQCMQTGIPNEIYMATKPQSQLNFSSIVSAEPYEIDDWIGYDSVYPDSANNTFTDPTMNLSIGSNITLTNVWSTRTYQFTGLYDPPNQIFNLGILKDADGNFIFVTHKKDSYTGSYTPDAAQVNYQLMIPVNHSDQTWYFFTDPYDTCPAGNLSSLQPGTVAGYIFDNQTGQPMYNVTVSLAGVVAYTNESGYYSMTVLEGISNLVGIQEYYNNYVAEVNVTAGETLVHNFSMLRTQELVLNGTLNGYAKDNSTGLPIYNASISLAGTTVYTSLLGYYNVSLLSGKHNLVSVKSGYSNFVDNVTIVVEEETVFNFTMIPIQAGSGESVGAVQGYVTDNSTSLAVPNATVAITGSTTLSDNSGYYILNSTSGDQFIVSFKSGYNSYAANVTIVGATTIEHNITLNPILPEGGIPVTEAYVYGTVRDNVTGIVLGGAVVSIGGAQYTTNETGNYTISVPNGTHNIVAVRTGYNPYSAEVEVSPPNDTLHDIGMSPAQVVQAGGGGSGSGVGPGEDIGPGIGTSFLTAIEKPGEVIEYLLTLGKIKRKLRQGTFIKEYFSIYNYLSKDISFKFQFSGEAGKLMRISHDSITLGPNESKELELTIMANRDPGVYNGYFLIRGDYNESVSAEITILEPDKLPIEALLMRLTPDEKEVIVGDPIKFKLDMNNLLVDEAYPVKINYEIQSMNYSDVIYTLPTDEIVIRTAHTILKKMDTKEDTPIGDYLITARAEYLNLTSVVTSVVTVTRPFYLYALFGFLPLWWLLPILLALVTGTAGYIIVRKKIEEKKKYHTPLEYNLTPQPGPRSIKVGKIAESSKNAYIDIDRLTTHCIIAGSTGGGKTVAAQDIIEECLDKGIAVIVFDPTAQWTGMLRKQDNKKMLSLYPQYGLNPKKDPKAYPGNIKPITNALQKIRLQDFMKPGEIQVFTTNTLDPKDIDIFVANTVREIFHSNLQEAQELKTMLVYDEVHRLLAKFGGSGEGFIQIERACREFRKWGIGVMLISQVLADFVGQIKANINTELQLRTRDEGDLERIKTKYGGDLLQSLVKASTGTGMIQNAEWNRGKPYFISFRPLKHNIRRLSDDELALYTKYNLEVDQVNFEIKQLKEESLDVYDLELEVKLALDKIKSGNFNITQIYLDELKPRLAKLWQGLGKQPKQFEIDLVNRHELEAEFQAAQKAKKEAEKATGTAVKEDKKEEIVTIKPLLLDNGAMVQNPQELLDSLQSMDMQIFRVHVNDKKNDLARWLRDEVKDIALADIVQPITSKKDTITAIQKYFAEKKKASDAAQKAEGKPK